MTEKAYCQACRKTRGMEKIGNKMKCVRCGRVMALQLNLFDNFEVGVLRD